MADQLEPPGWKHTLDEWRKIVQGITAILTLGALLWAMLGPLRTYYATNLELAKQADALEVARTELIQNLVDGQAELSLGQEAIVAEIRALKGESRLIAQTRGLSFVEEPVHLGDRIKLVVFYSLTEKGLKCRATEFTPLFNDSQGVVRAGPPFRPMNPLNQQVVRREILLDLPEGAPAGRTTVQLQMDYDCGGTLEFDTTDLVVFDILAEKR